MSTRIISEVSEELNISVRALHYYDEVGIMRPTRTKGGYRLYDDSDIERLKLIRLYREADLPVRKIELILDDPECDVIEVLKTHLSALNDRQSDVERYIRFTKQLIEETESEVV